MEWYFKNKSRSHSQATDYCLGLFLWGTHLTSSSTSHLRGNTHVWHTVNQTKDEPRVWRFSNCSLAGRWAPKMKRSSSKAVHCSQEEGGRYTTKGMGDKSKISYYCHPYGEQGKEVKVSASEWVIMWPVKKTEVGEGKWAVTGSDIKSPLLWRLRAGARSNSCVRGCSDPRRKEGAL